MKKIPPMALITRLQLPLRPLVNLLRQRPWISVSLERPRETIAKAQRKRNSISPEEKTDRQTGGHKGEESTMVESGFCPTSSFSFHSAFVNDCQLRHHYRTLHCAFAMCPQHTICSPAEAAGNRNMTLRLVWRDAIQVAPSTGSLDASQLDSLPQDNENMPVLPFNACAPETNEIKSDE